MGYTLLHKRLGICLVLCRADLDAFAARNDMTEWTVM